ncbi:MAG: hypothetical protein ACJ74W_19225 [Pyrinomonadaceae bacterium]
MTKLCTAALLFVTLCGLAGAVHVHAQTTAEVPTGLAVEVVYEDGRPAYVQVPHWTWFGRFRRIESWQPPAGTLPVGAVRITPVVEGAAVRINVAVMFGEKFLDKEEQIASYLVRVGEQVEVKELTRYGVVPFQLKLVRVQPTDQQMPEIVNRARALEVLSVEPKPETFPAYAIRVRNGASKSVTAMFLRSYTKVNGSPVTWMPHNQLNLPLIEPGAVYELTAVVPGSAGQTTPDSYRPEGLQRVVIVAVVFADGSYEGDAERAAYIRALWWGRKVQLTRVLALIERTLGEPELEPRAGIARFKTQVAALDEADDQGALKALRADFPTLPVKSNNDLSVAVQFELHQVKRDLLKAVEAFEQGQHEAGPEDFRNWLREVQSTYERWRARL